MENGTKYTFPVIITISAQYAPTHAMPNAQDIQNAYDHAAKISAQPQTSIKVDSVTPAIWIYSSPKDDSHANTLPAIQIRATIESVIDDIKKTPLTEQDLMDNAVDDILEKLSETVPETWQNLSPDDTELRTWAEVNVYPAACVEYPTLAEKQISTWHPGYTQTINSAYPTTECTSVDIVVPLNDSPSLEVLKHHYLTHQYDIYSADIQILNDEHNSTIHIGCLADDKMSNIESYLSDLCRAISVPCEISFNGPFAFPAQGMHMDIRTLNFLSTPSIDVGFDLLKDFYKLAISRPTEIYSTDIALCPSVIMKELIAQKAVFPVDNPTQMEAMGFKLTEAPLKLHKWVDGDITRSINDQEAQQAKVWVLPEVSYLSSPFNDQIPPYTNDNCEEICGWGYYAISADDSSHITALGVIECEDILNIHADRPVPEIDDTMLE